jgi:hypothetical protein
LLKQAESHGGSLGKAAAALENLTKAHGSLADQVNIAQGAIGDLTKGLAPVFPQLQQLQTDTQGHGALLSDLLNQVKAGNGKLDLHGKDLAAVGQQVAAGGEKVAKLVDVVAAAGASPVTPAVLSVLGPAGTAVGAALASLGGTWLMLRKFAKPLAGAGQVAAGIDPGLLSSILGALKPQNSPTSPSPPAASPAGPPQSPGTRSVFVPTPNNEVELMREAMRRVAPFNSSAADLFNQVEGVFTQLKQSDQTAQRLAAVNQ